MSLRGKLALLPLVAVCLLVGAGEAQAASCSYTGGSGGDWHTATNWSCGVVPDADDDVSLGSGDSVAIAAAATAGTLVIGDGGTITFSGGATLDVAGTVNIGTGTVGGTGTLVANGAFTKSNGSLSVPSGNIVLNEDSSITGGSISNTGGDVEINETFTIEEGASNSPFSASGDSTPGFHITAPDGHLINEKTGTVFSQTSIDNDGTLTAQDGLFQLIGGTKGATSDGDYFADAGATIQFGGCCSERFEVGATGRVGGAGAVNMSANPLVMAAGSTLDPAVLNINFGVLELNGTTPFSPADVNLSGATLDTDRPFTVDELDVTSGTLTGTANVNVPAGASMTKSTSGTLSLPSADTDLILNEDFDLAGGNISATAGEIFINETFTIEDTAAASPFSASGGSTPNIHVSAPNGHLINEKTGAVRFETSVDVDGTLTVEAGSLQLVGGTKGATSDGDYVADAGATLRFTSSTYEVGATGSVGGAGTIDIERIVRLAGGAVVDSPDLNIKGIGTLELNGTGPITLPSLDFEGGGFNPFLDTDRPVTATALNVTGAATITGTGSVTVPNGGSFTKTGSGSLRVTAKLFEAAADLILNVDATLAGGTICVARSDDSNPDQPTFQINRDFALGAGADALWYPCSGGRVRVNGPSGTFSKVGAGTSSSNGAIDVAGGSVTVGSGQTLSFANAYAQTGGATTVQAGGVLAANVALTGGVLGGGGQVTGNVTNVSGTLRPGTSPGTFSVTGGYTQGAAGTLQVDVDGSTQGTAYDHLDVGGAASLDGTLAVVQGAGFDPQISDMFQFLTSASRTGTFSAFTGESLPSGKSYVLDYPGAPDFGARLTVDPGPPRLSIDDVTIDEEDGARDPDALFTISLNQPAPPGGIEIDVTTANGTATANEDYRPLFTTVSFGAGQTSKTLSVDLLGDFEPEPDETFFVDLSNPTNGGVIGDGRGTATIRNDDGQGPERPAVSIDDIAVTEGNGRETGDDGVFTLSLDRPAPSRGLAVDVATADGTAVGGVDYSPRDTTVIFNSGETTTTLPVDVHGDLDPEADETFAMNLSNPRGSGVDPVLADPRGVATIRNDDEPVPAISIGDVELPEGNSRNKVFPFEVSLDTPAPSGGVTVDLDTQNRTAKAPGDYVEKTETLTFARGEQRSNFAVRVKGDEARENTERFSVRLRNPAGATVSDDRGIGEIENDDGAPRISVLGPGARAEGDSGRTEFAFIVALDQTAPDGGVRVSYETTHDGPDGPTAEGSDLQREEGVLDFAEGQRQKTVTVRVNGDAEFEPDERFRLELSGARRAQIDDETAQATIENDDPVPPNISITGGGEFPESVGQLTFTISLSQPAPAAGVRVDAQIFETFGGAQSGEDFGGFGLGSRTINFSQGEQEEQVTVNIVDDDVFESNERFDIGLRRPHGGEITGGGGEVIRIMNDDLPPPEISISGGGAVDEDAGARTFTISLSHPAPAAGVSVTVQSLEDEADFFDDFGHIQEIVGFAQGQQEKQVTVNVVADDVQEPNERFTVRLLNPQRATFAPGGSSTIPVIRNDDLPPPEISISGGGAVDEDAGARTFTISLSHPAPAGGVSVTVESLEDEADFFDDFGRIQRPVAFSQGQQEKQVTVGVVADDVQEPNERFTVRLLNPQRATFAPGGSSTIPVIRNDDFPPPPEEAPPPEEPQPDKILDVEREGGGTVIGNRIDCGDRCRVSFAHGTELILNAKPRADTQFSGWTGCDSVRGRECAVRMNIDREVTASFVGDGREEPPTTKRLEVNREGGGTVTGQRIDCGDRCEAEFEQGTVVQLEAKARRGTRFDGWRGCDTVIDRECIVQVTTNRQVTATFVGDGSEERPTAKRLDVDREGGGTVSGPRIDCGDRCRAEFDQGTVVQLGAKPLRDTQFEGWRGCDTVIDRKCIVQMTTDRRVTATFTRP